MIARQTLNIYIQYLKNLPRLRGYSLVYISILTDLSYKKARSTAQLPYAF